MSIIVTILISQEKKEEIWLSPMTKARTPTEISKGQSDNTNNATKKSWHNYIPVLSFLRTIGLFLHYNVWTMDVLVSYMILVNSHV